MLVPIHRQPTISSGKGASGRPARQRAGVEESDPKETMAAKLLWACCGRYSLCGAGPTGAAGARQRECGHRKQSRLGPMEGKAGEQPPDCR